MSAMLLLAAASMALFSTLTRACNFVVSDSEKMPDKVLHSNHQKKDCVMFFPSEATKELELTLDFERSRNASVSCGNAFVKIFESSPEKKRKKLYHLCSDAGTNVIHLNASRDIFILTVQTTFRLKYQYRDKEVLYENYEEGIDKQYLTKDECIKNEMFPCENTRKCYFNDSAMLCNRTKVLCIKPELRCNGKNDCMMGDHSDETGCSHFVWKLVIAAVLILLSFGTSFGCISRHNTALRSKNMVRFKNDIIKRKDIVKVKKYTY